MTETARALKCLASRPGARARVICMPYAGGGPESFRGWADELGADIEAWAAVLPGHAGRLSEPLPDDLRAVADVTATAIASLPPLPTALFGHSMGAWLALECAHALVRRGARPTMLFVSGRAAPGFERHSAFAHLPDRDFLRVLHERFDGLPPEIAASAEIMDVFLPVLRADVSMLERYVATAETPLDMPIHVLAAAGDRALAHPGAIDSWEGTTTGPVRAHRFEGGHFYLHDQRDAVTELIRRLVDPLDASAQNR